MSTDDANPNRLVLRGLDAVLACIQEHPKALREVHASAACVPALSPYVIALEAQGGDGACVAVVGEDGLRVGRVDLEEADLLFVVGVGMAVGVSAEEGEKEKKNKGDAKQTFVFLCANSREGCLLQRAAAYPP